MDDPRDDIDAWLQERVTPLLPRPGTFEQVRKRARRRKLTQAAIAAGGAAVIVAVAATVPSLVTTQLRPSNAQGPVHSQSATPTAPAAASPTPAASLNGSASPAATPPPAVPPNFAPTSITFVSTGTGWVIGQAGTPGQCGPPNPDICTSLAGTDDGGATWHGIPAPVTGPPDGATGVSGVRSLDGTNGWAFGPQLYATHDGGQTWTRIATHGLRVTDLETVNGVAFAVWARCTGTGPDFAARCTSFSLYATPAGTNSWAPVPGVTGLGPDAGGGGTASPASAQLVLTGSAGYLLAPSGGIYSGPVTAGAGWQPVTGAPGTGCGPPGPAQADGLPASALLAATGTGLVELCAAPAPGQPDGNELRYSADGGRTWVAAGPAPLTGAATSLSGTPAGQVVIATTEGVAVSSNAAGAGSLRWRTVRGASAPGGFTYVGMTTSDQGVAIPADTGLHAVWFTYDGGRHWQASAVR